MSHTNDVARRSVMRTLAATAHRRGAAGDGTRSIAAASGRSPLPRTEARCCRARGGQEGRLPPPRASLGRSDVREHRRRMDRWCRGRTHRPAKRPGQAVHREHYCRLHEVLPQLPPPGVRADAGGRHRGGGVADVGGPAQSRRALPVPHHDACSSRLRHLRVGDGAEPPARSEKSTAACRIAPKRREAAASRCVRSRSRTAARRSRAQGSGSLRDCVLRRAPPRRDPPTRMA